MKKLTIAIDGHSSCGKSTIAKQLAKKLNYIYIDTGAMYRAVTLFALRNQLIENGEVKKNELIEQLPEIDIVFRYNERTKQSEVCLNNEIVENEIRSLWVSEHVSPVSTIKEVREKMVSKQQEMGKNDGVVLDGRDIGTVVFPDADFKLFMTASAEVRAKRRYKELTEKGHSVSFNKILRNIENRDHIDQNRAESPLMKADDAIVLDNSNLTPNEQINKVMNMLNMKIEGDI